MGSCGMYVVVERMVVVMVEFLSLYVYMICSVTVKMGGKFES